MKAFVGLLATENSRVTKVLLLFFPVCEGYDVPELWKGSLYLS